MASAEAVQAAYGKPTAVTRPGPNTRLIYDDVGPFVIGGFTMGVFRPGEGKLLFRY